MQIRRNPSGLFVIIAAMKYYVWTEGCQMNVADTQRVSSGLENLGYKATARPEDASVIVLNTCAVRQVAEDKAYGRLSFTGSIEKSQSQPGHQSDGLSGGYAYPGKIAQTFSVC